MLLNDSFVLRNELNSFRGCTCAGSCAAVVRKPTVTDTRVVSHRVFTTGHAHFKSTCVDIVTVVVGSCALILVYNNQRTR